MVWVNFIFAFYSRLLGFSTCFLLQWQEYECSVAELLTAIDWDKKDRGVGFWNDTMEFYQVLLEKLEVEMEVTVNVNEL